MISRLPGKKRSFLIVVVTLVSATCLLAYSAWGFWQRYDATHNPHPVIPTTVTTQSTTTPDETPLGEVCSDHTVAATDPRYIEIPAIDVFGCIQQVGIDQNNAIAVPTNIYLAGWYVNSQAPGEQGVSVIDGHVFGRYNDAIFSKLSQLKAGDIIKIERGDGQQLTFAVVDKESYVTEHVMDHLFEPLSGVEQQLNLITCDGVYDEKRITYDKRLVVRAELQGS